MFSKPDQLIKRTGKKGVGRYDYLQLLVTEFQDTKSEEAKEQVVANLANFAYDPINFEYLRKLNVINLLLDLLSEDNTKLIQYALGGICNLVLDPENKEYILHCNGVKIVSSCLSSCDEETVLSAISTLMFLVTPQSKPEITSPTILSCMIQFSTSQNARIRNLATVFLEDYCSPEEVEAARQNTWSL
ncbi:hypothetical protein L9F63_002054 [Diploptera punctata]|uniref:Armadillo repeat-containing protein 7 n=1 Tax=Diploptera punctata TaxID=6984 RepID=A0AAD8EIF5_DIPPU|nr:hypothetical protein L9F63_002054 [Diploptera punctata]